MKFVIAPDSFKGGLTAKEAANVMAEGAQNCRCQARHIR